MVSGQGAVVMEQLRFKVQALVIKWESKNQAGTCNFERFVSPMTRFTVATNTGEIAVLEV